MRSKCNASCLAALSVLMVISPLNMKASGNEWISTNGEWKYKEGDSYKTGWFADQKCWYYADYQTGILKKGWIASGDAWYYLNPVNAIMQESRWVDDGKYYIGNNGAMATDTVIDGKEILADGTFIPFSDSKSVVLKNAEDLAGKVIEGNLYITEEAAKDLVLSDVIVKGKIVIEGSNFITLNNVTASEIKNNKAETTIKFEGKTQVDKVTVTRSTSLMTDDQYKGMIKEIEIQSTTKTETIVNVKANEVTSTTYAPTTINQEVGKVTLKQESSVQLNANVEELVVQASAGHSKVDVAKDVTVAKATISSESTLGGKGTITKLEAKVDNIKVDTKVNEIVVAGGVKNPPTTTDNVVAKPEESKPSGGAGGGGTGGGGSADGDTDKEVGVSTATISGELKIGKTLKATANADATGTLLYTWFISETENNTDGTKIENNGLNELVLTEAYLNKYIYVEISGANNSKAISVVSTKVITNVEEIVVKNFSELNEALIGGKNALIADGSSISLDFDLKIPSTSTLTIEEGATLNLTSNLEVSGTLEAYGTVIGNGEQTTKTRQAIKAGTLLSDENGEIKASTSTVLRFSQISQLVIKGKPLLIYKDTTIEVAGKTLTGPTEKAMVNLSALDDNAGPLGQFQHNGDENVTLGVLPNTRADINEGLDFLVLTYPNSEVHMDISKKVVKGGSVNAPYLTKLFVKKGETEELIVGPIGSNALLTGIRGDGSISVNDEYLSSDGFFEVFLYGKTTITQNNESFGVPVNITPTRSGDTLITSMDVINTAIVFTYDRGMHRDKTKELSAGVYYFDYNECKWYEAPKAY